MPPHDHHLEPGKSDQRWYVWERSGLETGIMGRFEEDDDKENVPGGDDGD
jgi:hypothetical protein